MGNDSNKRTQRSQVGARKPLDEADLHPDLVGWFEEKGPRPKWPPRKEWASKPLPKIKVIEVGLFDSDISEFLQALEEIDEFNTITLGE